MADENNKKIHEFYSSSKINQQIRYEIVKTTESIEQAVNEALRAYRKKK